VITTGVDRLVGKYFPYGQERPSATTDGKEKFATYFRDSETGLDYADQRYHQPGMGRFMTPDPYSGSASANDPGSWNRYAYTRGDPVNRVDPGGTLDCNPYEQFPDTQNDSCELIPQLPGGFGGGMCSMNPGACDFGAFDLNAYKLLFDCYFRGACGTINTQGQGASGPISVPNFSNSGTKQDTIRLDLQKLEGYLVNNPDCETWLAGGLNGPIFSLIGGLIDSNNFGYGDVNNSSGSQDYTTAAFGGWRNADGSLIAGLPVGTQLTVNSSGAFFNATAPGGTLTVGAGNYTGGTPQAQAAILIHELAHMTGAAGFVDDASSNDPAQNRRNVIANDALVGQHCGGLINAFQ
jgi:RHS repeat-associated protein